MYWFYEELKDDLVLQLIYHYLLSQTYENRNKITPQFLDYLINLCLLKKKPTIYILDQFNKCELFQQSEGELHKLFRTCQKTILISTNTDIQIRSAKSDDAANTRTLVLDEINNIMSRDQLKTVIQTLFPEENEEFMEFLIDETQSNLSLIFLFFKHCVEKNALASPNDLKTIYAKFCYEYIQKKTFGMA